jgi:hypothetical protein
MRLALVVVLVLVLVGSGLALAPPARAAAPNYPPLTGSVQGPTALGVNTAHFYKLVATGGPAFALNGTQIGNLTFHASVVASNTTGVSVSPTYGAVSNGSYEVSVAVGNVSQVVNLQVEYVSVYQTQNVTLNISYGIQVVHPYVLTGLIQAGGETVIAFSIQVSLDGQVVGALPIPALTPKEEYNFSFDYIVTGLSAGYHTFTLTLPTQHGQVHFAGGALSYQYTFYISGPAPNYTLYYVLGVVALVGVILIFLIFVGARRRSGSRS